MERITERNFEMMSGKYQKEQLEIEARLKEVTETLNESYENSLYEDKVMERITERNFEMMSGKYQKEQLEIEARLKEVTETLNESYEKSRGIRDFLALIRNYQGLHDCERPWTMWRKVAIWTQAIYNAFNDNICEYDDEVLRSKEKEIIDRQGLKELDATVINALIDKILVSEREKMADGTVKQEIKIYYKFIVFVDELHIIPPKRWAALPAKNCTVCGVEYVPGSGASRYCPACAQKIRREKSNESKRRSREQKRIACMNCPQKMTD